MMVSIQELIGQFISSLLQGNLSEGVSGEKMIEMTRYIHLH